MTAALANRTNAKDSTRTMAVGHRKAQTTRKGLNRLWRLVKSAT